MVGCAGDICLEAVTACKGGRIVGPVGGSHDPCCSGSSLAERGGMVLV